MLLHLVHRQSRLVYTPINKEMPITYLTTRGACFSVVLVISINATNAPSTPAACASLSMYHTRDFSRGPILAL
jgi:hypothetical protein